MNELKLLKGAPIEIGYSLKVYPAKIEEITEIGEEIYNSYVSAIMIDKSVLNNVNENQMPKEILDGLYKCSDLEFILYLSLTDRVILKAFMEALSLFLKCDIRFNQELGIIISHNENEIVLNDEIFNEFKKVVVKQNFLKDGEKSKFKPANDKARALLEKLNKAKEKIQKQNKEDGLSLKDIVSIVATYSNDINILSVWNLTVYQLFVCYMRLIMWDDYHNKYQLIPHSSDIESLDLKHWAIDINKIN